MFVLLALLGCRVAADDFTQVPNLPRAETPTATPPPARSAAEERLFQLLYAGEGGPTAYAAGQKVRVRAWLASMAFTEGQSEALRAFVRVVLAEDEAHARALAGLDARETAAYASIYTELDARLALGGVSDAELARYAERLSAARVAVRKDGDPLTLGQAHARALLAAASTFVQALDQPRKEKLLDCRFFLQKRLDPLRNVGDYQAMTGVDWDGSDFSSLDATGATRSQGQMDLGGLWAVEKMRAPPGEYIQEGQAAAIAVMAAQEPALAELLGLSRSASAPAPAASPGGSPG